MKKTISLIMFITLSALTGLVGAQTTGEKKHFGVIDQLYFDEASIIIDDMYYKMALNMKVYTASGKASNRYGLKKGQKVHFTKKRRDQYTADLKAVWILPKSTTRPEDD